MVGLGCAKNLVDGEIMLGHLHSAGIRTTADAEQAEVVVVNTCGFIIDAKQESVDAILEVAEAKRRGKVKRLLVTGCMAQRFAQELAAEIPEIDGFVGLDELEQIVPAALGRRHMRAPDQQEALRVYDHHQPRIVSTGSYAYLKVAEGCNNPCTFCTIPSIRGSFRSRPVEDLVAEAQNLERLGIQEIILIAQDTTRYGEDLGLAQGLRQLVTALLEKTSIPWVRFLYAYPSTLDNGLFELMAESERFISYLDIPLQHTNRKVLKAMRRGGDGSTYAKLISEARQMVPELAIRTTFMVGFPGEGEEEFQELMSFVRMSELDHMGVFTYSWQEECPGAELGDPVPEELKQERRSQLMEAQQEISLGHNQKLVGRCMPALVSGPLAEMELLTEARLQRQAPEIDGCLLLNDGNAPPGSLIEAEITEAHPYDLVGRVVKVSRSAGEDTTPLASASERRPQ
jgi:ribosomal protein S12 methylthiotransferase